jgi:streptomycin 6-kinase
MSDKIDSWSQTLPGTVRELAERWSLRVGEPYLHSGETAWTARATDAEGRECVLKIGRRHFEADHEAAGLRVLAGQGAIRLYAAETSATAFALLLERCTPGTDLRERPEPEQDVVLAGLLPRLWVRPPDGHPFRPLQLMCAAWATSFEQRYAEQPQMLPQLDPGLVRLGMQLFRTLSIPAEHDVLLSTDLHAGNVLAAQREPWLMIDPKPFVGDPTYDVLQHLLNCPERLVRDPIGLARRLADLLDLDANRLQAWLFARCVQMSPEWTWLPPVAVALSRAL